MPTYNYQCGRCEAVSEHYAEFHERHEIRTCRNCGANSADYIMTMPNVVTFEPYHDESLNCDIYGKRHRQQVMQAQGVYEAGDSVGGARNFDENANNGGVLPLQGVSHDDTRRNNDKRKKQGEEMVVGVDRTNAYGETRTTYTRVKDLETKSDTKAPSIGAAVRQ